jgi:hypothetical protein
VDGDAKPLDLSSVSGILHRGGTIWRHPEDQHALQTQAARELIRGYLNAETGAGDAAMDDDPRHKTPNLVYRNGKTDPGEGPGGTVNGGVHADEPPRAIQ